MIIPLDGIFIKMSDRIYLDFNFLSHITHDIPFVVLKIFKKNIRNKVSQNSKMKKKKKSY